MTLLGTSQRGNAEQHVVCRRHDASTCLHCQHRQRFTHQMQNSRLKTAPANSGAVTEISTGSYSRHTEFSSVQNTWKDHSCKPTANQLPMTLQPTKDLTTDQRALVCLSCGSDGCQCDLCQCTEDDTSNSCGDDNRAQNLTDALKLVHYECS